MKIYDAHMHTGFGTPDAMALLGKMEEAGYYGGILLSAAPDVTPQEDAFLPFKERIDNVLEWTRGSEGRLYPFLWVHPFEKDICEKIKNVKDYGIRGFKMICDNYTVDCPESMKLLKAMEEVGLPITFHCGILHSLVNASKNNRHAYWECMGEIHNLRFATAHTGWPWYDECIALYGALRHKRKFVPASEMFFDLTPGTPPIYRKDQMFKMYNIGVRVEDNVILGTDYYTSNYLVSGAKFTLDNFTEVFNEVGITPEQQEKIFNKNFLRYIGEAE